MNEIEQNAEPMESRDLSIPKPSKEGIGWLLVGGGLVGSLVNVLRGDRGPVDWLIPVSLAGLGFGVLLSHRQSEMESAEDTILAELDKLDPIARAQVLKAVAQDEVGRLPGLGSSDD
jgi:hypothetical protein